MIFFSFKSGSSGSSTTTEAPVEPTQRNRNRFGGAGNGGFKRARPGQKQPVDEEVQKDSSSSVSAEKPSAGRNRYRASAPRSPVSTTSAPSAPSSSSSGTSGISRPAFNKLNVNRRRGRPTTAPPATSEETQESGETSQGGSADAVHDSPTTPKSAVRARIPAIGARPIRPGARVNLRPRPGQATTTTTLAPEVAEGSVEEPAGEGTEEETHEVGFFIQL